MSLNIVTLPSNIGGISVPDAVKGPLTALYGPGQYDKATLRYPRDLGTNPARKHSIVFTIKEIVPKNLAAVLSSIGTGLQAGAETLVSGTTEGIKNATNEVDLKNKTALENLTAAGAAVGAAGVKTAIGVGKAVSPAISDINKFALNPDKKVVATVGLYVPDNVNVSYAVDYDDNESLSQNLGRFYFLAQGAASLGQAFKDQGDKTITSMLNTLGNDPYVRDFAFSKLGQLTGTNLTRLALNAGGYAMNPQLQVLFRGIGFREFQFDFIFTPYDKQESEKVKEIIQTFKYHAAPEITANDVFTQGYYYKVPQTFDINFYYGNEENRNVNKIGECVLTQVDVDYAGSGQWSTHNDGSPTQIKMTLRFKETIIIDKNRIGKPGTSEGGF